MIKALLRKQLLEIRAFYFGGRKTKDGKKKQVKNPKGMLILFAFLYLILMGSFFAISAGLSSAMFPLGLDFVFFTVMSAIAFVAGVFGSVLSTAQALFRSNDNEFLLSMPIPPSKIVFIRMITVYLMGFIYECIIIVPAVICWLIWGNVTFAGVICSVLFIFVLGFLIAAFSCLAGWIVSLIALKFKNQKVVGTILIIIVIGVFYYFQFNASRIFESIALNAGKIAAAAEGGGRILFSTGLAMTGNIPVFLVFTAACAVLFFLAYYAVTRSFSRIALMKPKEKEISFSRSHIRSSDVSNALLRKEFKRFVSSMPYMLNMGIGVLFMTAAAVIMLIKFKDIRSILSTASLSYPSFEQMLPVLAAAAVCVLSSFIQVAAPSISMEGAKIWIYRSMPVDPYAIFLAKIKLHVFLACVPALLCTLVLGFIIRAEIVTFICMVLFVSIYIVLSASIELMIDLKKPRLSWTNETQAIKTNVNTLVSMLITVMMPVVPAGLYFLLQKAVAPSLYLACFFAVFAILTLLVHRWLSGKGRKRFGSLEA